MGVAEFAGTPRFDVSRRIGAGGMGVVYEAFDRDRGMWVAIKTIPRLDAASLYRFKKEFRAVADIVHDNLVRLHELVCEDDEWFFTMDLVRGADFLTYVWGHDARSVAETHGATGSAATRVDSALGLAHAATSPAASEPISGVTVTRKSERPPSPRTADWAAPNEGARPEISPGAVSVAPARIPSPSVLGRLRPAFTQLVAAVEAIHQAGKVHRDVKPGNVLVEASGRVVLLDFGLAMDLASDAERATETGKIFGTPAYMAPEQASPQGLTEAADWYAVGVVLFEALTGQLPFTGAPVDILLAKQWQEAPRPSAFVTGIPHDLDELCAALLAPHPSDRPSGAEIRRRLGAESAAALSGPVSSATSSRVAPAALVGRTSMLGTLWMALDAVRRGRPARVHVVGRSGMGKSTLVRHFLSEVEAAGDALVLAGRCYEHESLPYKGFDAVVDALSRHLAALPRAECAELVPRDARALCRVFPVLDRAPPFAAAPRRAVELADPHQLRTRAFGALRELLGRLADRRPVVLHIDDLQWGDADSAALLAEVTAPPDAPALLVVVAYRSEDVGAQPWLDALARSATNEVVSRASSPLTAPFTCTLSVDKLDAEDAVTLAASLLGGERDDARVVAIARESGGSPFFIGELVRHALSMGSDATTIRLEDVVESRVRALSLPAQRLLEVVATAGHPLARGLALGVAELTPEAGDLAIAALRAGRLLRTGRGDKDRIEPYHDRIRESVVRALSDEARRTLHGRLADALDARGDADPDVLYAHCEAAGLFDRAALHAEAAAARAAGLLAFDRAAELYQRALELTPSSSPRVQPLRVLHAESLARAGRGAAAAEAYMAAADREAGASSLELRRKASEQLLFSGHIDRGLDLVRQVLADVGMRLATSPLTALLGLLVVRVVVALRGTSFRVRPEAEIPADVLARIDACSVVANGLSFVDNIQGKLFQARAFLLALRAGEPARIVHALAGEAVFRGVDGHASLPDALALLDRARTLIDEAGVEHHEGTLEYGRGMVFHITGHWEQARDCFARAESLLEGARAAFYRVELDGAQSYGVTVLVLLGRLREASRRHAELRREAEDRGDLFLGTNLCIGIPSLCWLFDDQVLTARTLAAEAMARWSPRGFHLQHWHELIALTSIDLYDGEPERAAQRIATKWPALRRSMLLRIEYIRLYATYMRAACSLAMAARAKDAARRTALVAAERDARALRANGAPWAAGLAALIRAAVWSLRGERHPAMHALEEAAATLDTCRLALFATLARKRLGELRGGDEGAALVLRSDAWLMAEGVRRPERVADMLAPGFPRRPAGSLRRT